jgi:kynurenine formamidase
MKSHPIQYNRIDLTHLLNENITVYPGTVRPKFEVFNTVEKDGFAELNMTMVLHSGTHMDAPCHIVQNSKSLDKFPIDKFIGNAIVIPSQDITEISVGFLQTYEDKIKQAEFILFFTGWQYKWNTEEYFEDAPVPTREAAMWLTNFHLKGIGCDSFSMDKMIPAGDVGSDSLPNHHIFLGKEILLIENLTNLDKLPDSSFQFYTIPLKIENADGSPVRAFAMIDR